MPSGASRGGAERDRELRAVGTEGQPEHEAWVGAAADGQLPPVEVPDAHAGVPPTPRLAAASRPPCRRRALGRCGGCRASGRAGREERAERPDAGVPEADAATFSGRPPAAARRASTRSRGPARREGLEAARSRSVSASISSTLPSNLATASVRPSGLMANVGGEVLAPRVGRVGAEGPAEPTVAGHVPDGHARVDAGRVEGAAHRG